MGLLERAIASTNAVPANSAVPKKVTVVINNYHKKNPVFHLIILQGNTEGIADMTAGYGAVCTGLPGKKCLLLLPGNLDRELFAHRLSKSTGSIIVYQSDANSPSHAIGMLAPYLR